MTVDERIKTQQRAKLYFRSDGGYPMGLVPRGELPMERRPALLPGRRSRRPRRNVWVRR